MTQHKRTLVPILLAFLLLFAALGGRAYATEGDGSIDEQPLEALIQSPQDALAEHMVDETPSDQAQGEPQQDNLVEADDQAAPTLTVLSEGAQVTLEPKRNTTTVAVRLDEYASLVEQGTADAVRVHATMSHNGQVTREVDKTIALADFDASQGAADVDFGTFGPFTATVDLLKDGAVVQSLPATQVNVIADEYNIAPLTATMPVTLLSLSLWGEGSIRTAGPTLIMLQRAAAYNWDALPQAKGDQYGVYGIPYFTEEELRIQHQDPHGFFLNEQSPVIADYVHDLYAISPDSTFNLYFGDNFSFLAQSCIYANGIPESHYTLNVLSDGTGSYTVTFADPYSGADPRAQHEQYVGEWLAAKQHAYETGTVTPGFDNASYDNIQKYVWAMVDSDPKASWWLTRPRLLSTAGDENAFGAEVATSPKIRSFNIGNALKAIQAAGDDCVNEFKALYNFNDNYFAEAEQQGKDAMIFLGTVVSVEEHFSEYARFVMEYYGDDYVYYYKGHPASPTEMFPTKQSELEALGITDVNASIAAELILFFNPEVYLSGYQSSTYSSVPKGMGKGLFNTTKEFGLSNELYTNMDFWMTPVSDETPEAARKLCTEGHNNFLVEFSDEVIAENGYDIAIWDATDLVIIYYKLDDDGNYIEVSRDGSEIKGDMSLPEGTYVIQSCLHDRMVLDNPNSSKALGTNAHIWTYNGGANQQWKIAYDEQGYATITNVASGLALDVAGGSKVRGANILQWADRGGAHQKWNVKRNDNGSYTLISSLDDNLVADVDHASTRNGANVATWTKTGKRNQAWYFLPLDPKVSPKDSIEIEDGYYSLSPKAATNLRLDVANWAVQDGGNLLAWPATGSANQCFRIAKQESGFYTITNVFSGKVLDVEKGSPISGTNVLQWGRNGGKNQEWAIAHLIDGSYTFRNVGTNLMLDLFGANTAAGTNVDGYRANGSIAQKWLLNKVDDPYAKALELAQASTSIKPGTYVVRSSLNNSAVLDVERARADHGANVALWSFNNGKNQRWMLRLDKNGLATIINENSGRALAYYFVGREANVYQADVSDAANQKWVVVEHGDQSVSLLAAAGTGFALDAYGRQWGNGTNIQLYPYEGHAGQRFQFLALNATTQ